MFLGHENAGKHNLLNMGRRMNVDDGVGGGDDDVFFAIYLIFHIFIKKVKSNLLHFR